MDSIVSFVEDQRTLLPPVVTLWNVYFWACMNELVCPDKSQGRVERLGRIIDTVACILSRF